MEIDVNGGRYQIGAMPATKQLHIARRLAPLVAGLAAAHKPGQAVEMAEAVQPIAAAFASLSDADTDYVVHECLKTVKRQIGGAQGWAPVMSSAGTLMYEDIDLLTMIQLTVKVVETNLSPFLSALPSLSAALKGAAAP